MRVAAVSSLVLVIACGGSKKPAAEPTETPAPETSASSSSDNGAPSDSDASSAASASAAPAAEAAPPVESSHPVPNVTGMLDGKPFLPKMAHLDKPAAKDGRVVVVIDERTECSGDPPAGTGVLTVTTPWEDAYKQDLGSLKRGGKKGGGEISFARAGAGGKKDFSGTFKPSGRVTVTKAATEQGSTGKVNLDLTSGDYMLSGDLDVQVCVDVKKADAAAKGGAPVTPKTPAKAGGKKKKKD